MQSLFFLLFTALFCSSMRCPVETRSASKSPILPAASPAPDAPGASPFTIHLPKGAIAAYLSALTIRIPNPQRRT